MTEIALRVDIAERRRAEQERDQFFHLAADLMAVIDLDGRLRRVNPSCERTLGHAGTDLIGRSLLDLVHPEDRGAAAAELRRLVAGARRSTSIPAGSAATATPGGCPGRPPRSSTSG